MLYPERLSLETSTIGLGFLGHPIMVEMLQYVKCKITGLSGMKFLFCFLKWGMSCYGAQVALKLSSSSFLSLPSVESTEMFHLAWL